MDDAKLDGQDIESVLRHGAKALFDSEGEISKRELKYDDASVEELLKNRENAVEEDAATESENMFKFAKIWNVEQRTTIGLEQVAAQTAEDAIFRKEKEDFWSRTIRDRIPSAAGMHT